MLSWFFGNAIEEEKEEPVPEGHRIHVVVEGQRLPVDVDVLAEFSALFLQVQLTSAAECPLEDFPGGAAAFRKIVEVLRFLQVAKSAGNEPKLEDAPLKVDEDNVLNLFEAAWLLECPKLFEIVMASSLLRSLSSRRAVEILEHLLPFTTASVPPQQQETTGAQFSGHNPACTEAFLKTFLLETQMWQRTEAAVVELAAQLDLSDFLLGPRLATGSVRVCACLLRLHRKQEEETGYVGSALLPVTSVWKNLVDKPLRIKIVWDAHLFALYCIHKHLLDGDHALETQGVPTTEELEDKVAHEDISLTESEHFGEEALASISDLVEFVDIPKVPPNLMGLLIRTLMQSERMDTAKTIYAQVFSASLAVRRIPVPSLWLRDVAGKEESISVLLKVLQEYKTMSAMGATEVIQDVLLDAFLGSATSSSTPGMQSLLSHPIIEELVGACFAAGCKASASSRGEASASDSASASADHDSGQAEPSPGSPLPGKGISRCPKHWGGAGMLAHLGVLGARLFEATLLQQNGFLPRDLQSTIEASIDPQPEPIVKKVESSCLWDEGLLPVELLQRSLGEAAKKSRSSAAGAAATAAAVLSLGQKVILRHLWHRFSGRYIEIPELRKLWELAYWPLCEQRQLIHEAFEYLKGTYRQLQGPGGRWCPEHEEAMFEMFAALDLARLPSVAFSTPWMPPQVGAVRLWVQLAPVKDWQHDVKEEIASENVAVQAIKLECTKLENKLNIVEQRSIVNKSQINDAVASINEFQRKKRESRTT